MPYWTGTIDPRDRGVTSHVVAGGIRESTANVVKACLLASD